MPVATPLAIQNDSTSSSSNNPTIKLLVCTANLGNAKIDADGWNAWIPKNGKIVQAAAPVRMTPPPKKPRSTSSQRGGGAGASGDGVKKNPTNTSTTTNNPRARKQRSSQDAQAFSLKPNDIEKPEQNGSDLPICPAPPIRTNSENSMAEYQLWLEKQQQQEEGGQEKEANEDDTNWVPSTLGPTSRRSRSPSPTRCRSHPHDSQDSYEMFLQRLQTHVSHTEEDGVATFDPPTLVAEKEQPQLELQQLSIKESFPDNNSSATLSLDEHAFPAFTDDDDDDDDGIGASLAKGTKQSMETHALTSFQRPDEDGDDERPANAPPRRNYSKDKIPTTLKKTKTDLQEEEYYDMIVIGMQEATFELHTRSSNDNNDKKPPEDKNKKDGSAPKPKSAITKKKKTSGTNNPEETNNKKSSKRKKTWDDSRKRLASSSSQHSVSTDDDWDSDDSLSSSDDEDLCILHDDGTVTIVDDYTKLIVREDAKEKEKQKTTSKGLKKLLAQSTTSAGKTLVKVGFQAGKAGYLVSKKVTKTAYKTAETANRYAGYGKDHTTRKIPTSVRISSNATIIDKSIGGDSWTDTDTLHFRLETEQIPGYQRALSYQLGEMRLLVYVRIAQQSANGGRKKSFGGIKSIEVESVKYQATGIGGVLANKGGIIAELLINHSTRLSFLSAHLEAHEGEKHFAARCTSFQDIMMGAGHKFYDASQSCHYSFVMGDLNFRTRLAGVNPERHLQLTHKMAANRDWRILNQFDELQMALQAKKCLVGYQTPYCNFAPTFKVSRSAGYHYNVKRSPSYTDRILFKSTDQLENLIPLMYEGVENCTTSDHKPIRIAFEVPLNPTLKWKPALPLKQKVASEKTTKSKHGVVVSKRETMHFFVSDIRCVIFPPELDKLKKTENSDLPNPVILFVTNPNSAIQRDDGLSKKGSGSIWNKLGLKSSVTGVSSTAKTSNNIKKTHSNISSSTTPNAPSSKYPSTSVQKETLRPEWTNTDESVHFTIHTHTSTGQPINLSSALLHFCVRDVKQKPFLIGSYVLNLAQLISISRGHDGSNGGIGGGGAAGCGGEDSASVQHGMACCRTTTTTNGSKATNIAAIPRRGCTTAPTDASATCTTGFPFVATPSTALLSASAVARSNGGSKLKDEHVELVSLALNPTQNNHNAQNLLPLSVTAAKSFQQLSRKGSMRHAGRGPSSSLVSTLVQHQADNGDGTTSTGSSATSNDKNSQQVTSAGAGAVRGQLQELNVWSLRLEDEPLIGGGLEVGVLKCCSIDVWWTTDEVE